MSLPKTNVEKSKTAIITSINHVKRNVAFPTVLG